MRTSGNHAHQGSLHLRPIRHGKFINDHIPAKFFRNDQGRRDDKYGGITIAESAVKIFQFSRDQGIRFKKGVKPLEEVDGLF